jgi:hypothetical protein
MPSSRQGRTGWFPPRTGERRRIKTGEGKHAGNEKKNTASYQQGHAFRMKKNSGALVLV